MSTITPQSLTLLDSSGNTRTGGSEKLIPNGGTLQATVRQVSQDQLSPNVFRLKVEANSVLMELKVQQPVAQGSQVTLSRSANGQLSVTINAQDTSKNPISNKSSELQNSRTYQTSATPVIHTSSDSTRLNRLIPTGQSINAQVVTQPPSQTTTQTQTLTPQAHVLQQTAPQPQTGLSQQAHTPLAQNAPIQTVPRQTLPPQTQPLQSATPKALATPLPLPVASQASTPNTTASAPVQTPLQTSSQTPVVTSAVTPLATPTAQAPAQTIQTPQTVNQAPSTIQSSPSGQPQTTATAPTQTPLTNQTQPQPQPQAANTKYNSDPSANIMTVKIKGENVTLKTSANLPPLQQVQISRGTTDQLLIRWSQPISSPPTTSPLTLTQAQTQTIESNMRELLPQQITLTDGMQQLANTTQSSTSVVAGQIDKIAQSLMLLFGVQPGAAEAKEAIKQNINSGGLFTENKLANNQPPPKDMKKFLGKMQALAEQLPDSQKQIIQTTIGKMLARITTNQLQSLQSRQERVETNERSFQLDLPIQNQNSLENVELRISQRSQKNSRDEAETIWKVRLHFDLEEAGSIDAELSLNQERNELSAAFTCAKDDTAISVRKQLDSFKTQLNALGLNVPALACKQGVQGPQQSPIQKQLIDIKT